MTGVANSPEYWEFDEESFSRDAVTTIFNPHYSEVHGKVMTFRGHPVFTANGAYDGYVSISLLPSVLLGQPPMNSSPALPPPRTSLSSSIPTV